MSRIPFSRAVVPAIATSGIADTCDRRENQRAKTSRAKPSSPRAPEGFVRLPPIQVAPILAKNVSRLPEGSAIVISREPHGMSSTPGRACL